jgi:anti-sigma factor RsiW
MTELSDELLVAYVDGQLAQKQAGAVEKVLAHDDVIARRVAALKKAHRSLEAAFEAILAGEEAKAVSHPIPPSPGLLIPWDTLVRGGLAAAGIVVAIGLFIAGYGWPLSAPEQTASGPADTDYVGSLPQDWREEVTRAQALLGRASLEIGLDSNGDRDFIALRLGRAIGAPLALPDLEDYRFARAQILRVGDEPLAQLLYLGATGAPLALYVKKGGADAAPAAKRYGGLSGVAWSQGGVAYLLAGDGDEASLLDLAETIRKGSDVRSPLGASTRAPQRSR